MSEVSIRTPSGRVVVVDETALEPVAVLITDARGRAFDEVLELLDRDYERMKDCGDTTTAELVEIVRAKVRAKKDL